MANRSIGIMVLLSEDGLSYVEQQSEKIAENYGGRCGKSGIVRGIIDGFAQAGFDLSSAPTSFHIAAMVKAALGKASEVKQ